MNVNNGPCRVKDCDKNDPDKYTFKKFTEYAKKKLWVPANPIENKYTE